MTALREALAGPLAPLAALPRFLIYKVVPDPKRPGKTNKFPVDPATGAYVDAATQGLTCEQALAALPDDGEHGVGFYFDEADGFWFLDVDGAWTPDEGWSPLVGRLDALLPGAAREVSHSGTGLHYFGRGPVPEHRCRDVKGDGLELYSGRRFVALTGAHISGSADAQPLEGLAQLVAEWFPPLATGSGGHDGGGPREDWSGPDDDDELIALIEASTHRVPAFGDSGPAATDAELWRGDAQVLAELYPETDPSKGRPFDASTAGWALARALGYWTGCDLERMERLLWRAPFMEVSGWDAGKAYRTLRKRVAEWPADRKVLQRGTVVKAQLPGPGAEPAPERPPRGSLLDEFGSAALFHGCVYIRGQHRAYVPGVGVLRPEAFNAQFGGYEFFVKKGTEGAGAIKSDAFFAFSQSARYECVKCDLPAFDPTRAPGEVFEQDGKQVVNIYEPADVPRSDGDVQPLLDHVNRLLPSGRDAEILLSWMAAVVQYPGHKFLWSPVVTGGKGDGKSILFEKLLTAAVGPQYCNIVKPAQMVGKHATWMLNHVFSLCDDVGKHVPEEWLDEVKTLITGSRQLVEPKGVDTFMARVCTNIAFTSNHKRAIRVTPDERRFAMLWCERPDPADVVAFANWTDDPANLQAVAGFLASYEVPADLNPLHVKNAPHTSSMAEAVSGSGDRIDQLLEDALAEGAQGFRGGLVSMQAFEALIEAKGIRGITRTVRLDALERAGYVPHPNARSQGDGWTSNPVAEAGGKKLRVFVKRGHPAEQLPTGAAVVKHFVENLKPPVNFGDDGKIMEAK